MSTHNYFTFLFWFSFFFFVHRYVYLLCIHHDILEQSHKRGGESLVSPFDFTHSSRQCEEHRPAISGTQKVPQIHSSSQIFQCVDWVPHQGKCDPSEKLCNSLFKYISTKSKHFHILPLGSWIFDYLLFLNLFSKAYCYYIKFGNHPFPQNIRFNYCDHYDCVYWL